VDAFRSGKTRQILAKPNRYSQYFLNIGSMRSILAIFDEYWQYLMNIASI